MEETSKSGKFILISTLSVMILAIITNLDVKAAYYIQMVLYPYFGGSSGLKISFFFIFILIPLFIRSITYKLKIEIRIGNPINLMLLYLFPNLVLYGVGFFLFKHELESRALPNSAEFLIPINSLSYSAPNSWLHHHLLKPTLAYALDMLYLNGIFNVDFLEWTHVIPGEVYKATAVLLIMSFLLWVILGYMTLSEYGITHYFVLSVPAFGIFVTSIDGGIFTSFSYASLGAYLSFLVYLISKKENIKNWLSIPLIYLFSTLPFLLVIYTIVLLKIPAYDNSNNPQALLLFPTILSIFLLFKSFQTANKKLRIRIAACLIVLLVTASSLGFLIMYKGFRNYGIVSSRVWNATIYSPALETSTQEEIENIFSSEGIKIKIIFKEGPFIFGTFSSNKPFKFGEIINLEFVKAARNSNGGIYGVSPGRIGDNKTVVIFLNRKVTPQEINKLSNHPCVKDFKILENGVSIEVLMRHDLAVESVGMIFKDPHLLGAVVNYY